MGACSETVSKPGLTLEELARSVPGASILVPGTVRVRDVTCESRDAGPGVAMVCIRGTRADGHAYARAAADAGAPVLVVEHPVPGLEEVPSLLVPDGRMALAALADRVHDHPSGRLDVVGITGTDGKTTIASMAAAIATVAGLRPGVIGTLGIRHDERHAANPNTTPGADRFQRELARMHEDGARVVFAEVSSHALDMHRALGTEFRVVVLSHLGRDHLDWHGTLDAYWSAKARLFRVRDWRLQEDSGRSRVAVIPTGHDGADWMASESELPVVRVGFDAGATWRIRDVSLTGRGSVATLSGPSAEIRLAIALPGRFNVLNAATAAVACHELGVSAADIEAGLASLPAVPGRLEPVLCGQPFDVLVDFAHTPDAIATVLTTVREFTAGRILCVIGAGGDRDAGKRPLMAAAAAAGADVVILTSDNPRSEDPLAILAHMEAGLTGADRSRVHRVVDRAEAIAAAVSAAREGDTVLIAGKGHETTQEVEGARRPFDDRVEAARALAACGYEDASGAHETRDA